MTVTITINCENAAFDDPAYELQRIMDSLKKTFNMWRDREDAHEVAIMDINGQRVGSVKVSE